MSLPNEIIPVGLLGTGAAEAGAYEIERSVRFNSSDSAYLSRGFSTPIDQKKWTWAGWIKRSRTFANWDYVFVGNNAGDFGFYSDKFYFYDSITATNLRLSAQVFRDLSAWYHLQVVYDSANPTVANRLRVYINGIEITTWDVSNSIGLNAVTTINSAASHYLGGAPGYAYFSGYLADIHFIDGQALDPTSFTEVDATTGQLVPIEYTGTYGTNGFHLPFSDNSTAAALGTDTSGNGNDWTVNNILVSTTTTVCGEAAENSNLTLTAPSGFVFTSVTFASYGNPSGSCPSFTLGSCHASNSQSIVESYLLGNNSATIPATNAVFGDPCGGTPKKLAVVAVASVSPANNDSLVDTPTSYGTDTGAGGEVRGNYATLNPLDSILVQSNGNLDYTNSVADNRMARSTISVSTGKWYWECTGLTNSSGSNGLATGVQRSDSVRDSYIGQSANGYAYENSGSKRNNNTAVAYGASWGVNDIVGVAFDADNGTITFYKNGVSQGQAYSGLTSGPYSPAFGAYASSGIANFGQRPFAYTAPSGYKALCTTNLDDPVVAQPSTVMDVKLYTGNSSTQTISGLAFSPDLVWVKSRNNTFLHTLSDTVRGVNKQLYSSLTNAETSNTDAITAFNSDGFTVGANGGTGFSNTTYVGWAWDAGSSTVTNTDGSITSQVRANPSAGFSIVTYTGTGVAGTIGHELNVAPSVVLIKQRSGTQNWYYYTTVIDGSYDFLYLNSTDAKLDSATSVPTSSIFNVGTSAGQNGSGSTYVAYCFAPVDGYSSFGSYTGNGSTDGPFVYTGFRPRWVLIKESSASGNNWNIWDAARDNYNVTSKQLKASASGAEVTSTFADFTSNGFKIRTSTTGRNQSGQTYIYAAFAESPFKYARGR